MKNLISFLLILFFSSTVFSEEQFKLVEVSKKLSEPWGMTFVDDDNLLITEKTGNIIRIDMKTGEKFPLNMNWIFIITDREAF